jgi:hypothetical protein
LRDNLSRKEKMTAMYISACIMQHLWRQIIECTVHSTQFQIPMQSRPVMKFCSVIWFFHYVMWKKLRHHVCRVLCNLK